MPWERRQVYSPAPCKESCQDWAGCWENQAGRPSRSSPAGLCARPALLSCGDESVRLTGAFEVVSRSCNGRHGARLRPSQPAFDLLPPAEAAAWGGLDGWPRALAGGITAKRPGFEKDCPTLPSVGISSSLQAGGLRAGTGSSGYHWGLHVFLTTRSAVRRPDWAGQLVVTARVSPRIGGSPCHRHRSQAGLQGGFSHGCSSGVRADLRGTCRSRGGSTFPACA